MTPMVESRASPNPHTMNNPLSLHLSSTSSPMTQDEKFDVVKRVTSATVSAAMILTPMVANAEVELEVTELPPPYIPVIFAILILGGVGWLTASLGNVLDEEASLGLQPGARAKKERERSRSSYFNKQ